MSEASLAWSCSCTRVTVTTKRRQRGCGPWSKPRNAYIENAETVSLVEGHVRRVVRQRSTGSIASGSPGSWTTARIQGLRRNLGWSLGAPVADRNGTARETKPAGRREVGARSTSCDVGEPAPGDPAEQRSAPENRLVGGKR